MKGFSKRLPDLDYNINNLIGIQAANLDLPDQYVNADGQRQNGASCNPYFRITPIFFRSPIN